MNFKLGMKVGARFKLLRIKAKDNTVVEETPFFHNLVLETGLNKMGSAVGSQYWIDRILVGSGNTPPDVNQTQLQNFIASTTNVMGNSSGVSVGSVPYYLWGQVRYRFGEGVAAGNIAEVGGGWANNSCWNRALIKDINGDPTVMTVLPDEYLDVIIEVRYYPISGFSGSFNLLNKVGDVISSHTYTGLPYIWGTSGNINFRQINFRFDTPQGYNGDIGSNITQPPSGTSLIDYAKVSRTITRPTPRSLRQKSTLALTTGNGSLRSLLFILDILLEHYSGNGYKFEIDPPITKTSQDILDFTVEFSWDRYTSPP